MNKHSFFRSIPFAAVESPRRPTMSGHVHVGSCQRAPNTTRQTSAVSVGSCVSAFTTFVNSALTARVTVADSRVISSHEVTDSYFVTPNNSAIGDRRLVWAVLANILQRADR